MSGKFELQQAGAAYCDLCEKTTPWITMGQFSNLAEARAAQRRESADMHTRCGPGAWDNHYAIIALEDVSMSAQADCNGPCPMFRALPYNYPARPTDCRQSATVRYLWPADEAQPVPSLPDGWAAWDKCDACQAVEWAVEEAEEP